MNRQAEEAGKRADELLAQMKTQREQAPEPEGKTQEAPSGEQPQEQQAQAQPETPKQEQPKAEQSELEKLQHKFRVLEGKYKAEVPRLHQEKKQLIQQLEAARAEADKLRQQQAEQQSGDMTGSLSDKLAALREEYGDELYETLNYLVSTATKNQESQQSQQKQQEAAPQADDSARMLGVVQDLVGGQDEFNRIDNDPEFVAWLQEPDPKHWKAGLSRGEAMNKAFAEADLETTAHYFIEFRNQQKGSAEQKPKANGRNTELLEEQQQPGRTQQSNAPANNKPFIKESYIRQKQREFATKAYYRTPDGEKEARALEKEWLLASQEGRIQYGA